MSASKPLSFEGYTFRAATPEDLQQAREWTAADPDHSGRVAPGFWIEQGAGVDSYVMTDEAGDILFLRMERVCRFHIQYSPATTRDQRNRLRNAMLRGLKFLEVALSTVGVNEVIFDTTVAPLRNFVTRLLGFTAEFSTLSRKVPVFSHAPQHAPAPGSIGNDSNNEDRKQEGSKRHTLQGDQ